MKGIKHHQLTINRSIDFPKEVERSESRNEKHKNNLVPSHTQFLDRLHSRRSRLR